MALVAIVGLVALWGCWLYAVLSSTHYLVGWVFIGSDFIIGAGLLMLRVSESDTMQRVIKRIALSFLVVTVADLWWTLAFPTGAAKLEDTLASSMFYAISGMFLYAAAWLLYTYVRSLLGLSNVWLWTAFGIGAGVGVCNYLLGAGGLEAYTRLDFVAHCLNTALAAIGAFYMSLFALMGLVTRGGSICRWIVPVGLGFALILVGDLLYTVLGEHYFFGSIADWSYMAGNSMFFLYFVQGQWSRLGLAKRRGLVV